MTNSTPIDYAELLTRVTAIQIEALADISVTADAVDHFYHTQEATPYFINRISSITIEGDSEDFDRETVTVQFVLFVANLQEGYYGDAEAKLYAYIPQIKTYFHERELLENNTQTAPMDQLVRARITNVAGFQVFNGASGNQRLGTTFTLECEFVQYINRRY